MRMRRPTIPPSLALAPQAKAVRQHFCRINKEKQMKNSVKKEYQWREPVGQNREWYQRGILLYCELEIDYLETSGSVFAEFNSALYLLLCFQTRSKHLILPIPVLFWILLFLWASHRRQYLSFLGCCHLDPRFFAECLGP